MSALNFIKEDTRERVYVKSILNKFIIIVLALLLSACNSPTSRSLNSKDVEKENDYNYYVVMCKHPLGYVMKLIVDSETWADLYAWKSGVFRFKDVKGVFHQTSMGCYSNDLIRVSKEGVEESKQNN